MPKIIIFDTETTGIKDPIVIESAWLELKSLKPYKITNSWIQRFNPGKSISLGAMAIHHILDEELENCQPSHTFALPSDTEYLIGHNIDFDWKVIGKPNIKRICTLSLARHAWPNLDSYDQSALLYFLERKSAKKILKDAHNALVDVKICSIILKYLCEYFNLKTIENLWSYSENARIPKYMPFGKHKGIPIEKVPKNYIIWLLQQNNIDPYLKIAFEKIK